MQRRAWPSAENSWVQPLRDDDRDEVVLRSHQINRGPRRCSRPDRMRHDTPAAIEITPARDLTALLSVHCQRDIALAPCPPFGGIADSHSSIIIKTTRRIGCALSCNSRPLGKSRLALTPAISTSSHLSQSRRRKTLPPDMTDALHGVTQLSAQFFDMLFQQHRHLLDV